MALMARPVFLGAELVWGLRALEDGEGGDAGAQDGQGEH